MLASFDKTNRRDASLVQCLKTIGMPSDRITYLQDHEATSEAIHEQYMSMLTKSKSGDHLFLYYCGHGTWTDEKTVSFCAYDYDGSNKIGWNTSEMVQLLIDNFKGEHVLIAADCCHSGRFAFSILYAPPPFFFLIMSTTWFKNLP